VILEDRWRALRLLHRRKLDVALFLGLLDAALDVANRFGVFVDLGLVLRSKLPLEVGSFPVTESRMLLCCCNLASRAFRSVLSLSPKSFSNTARGFHSIGNGCVGLRHEMVCV